MSRFFVSADKIRDNNITIEGREAHHIIDVMRLRVSDKVSAFDGTGKEYLGFIKNISRGSLVIEITDTRTTGERKAARITLVQALPKKEKMDYIVEKATELGVSAIVPVVTARTIPTWGDVKKNAQVERWRRIAKEASKQCGRLDIPGIAEISAFADFVKRPCNFDVKLIAILNNETVPLKEAIKGFSSGSVAIAIGPEGDFSPDEAMAAKNAGYKQISLGPLVLKSDTAGLALLAILNYELQ